MEFIESQSIELEKTSGNFYQIVWRNFCRTHTIRLFSVSNSQSLYSSSKFNIRKFGNTVHFSPPTTLIYFNCSEDSDFIFTLIDDSKVYFIIILFSLSLFICESNFFSSSHFAVVNHFRIPRRFPVFVIHLQLHLVVERLSLIDIFSFFVCRRSSWSLHILWELTTRFHHPLIFIITYFSIFTWFYFRSRLRSGFLRSNLFSTLWKSRKIFFVISQFV